MEQLNYIDLKVRLEDLPFTLKFINKTCVMKVKNNSKFPLQNLTVVFLSSSDRKLKKYKITPTILPDSEREQTWDGIAPLDSISEVKYEYIDQQMVIEVIYDKENDSYEWRHLVDGVSLDDITTKKKNINKIILLASAFLIMLFLLIPMVRDEIYLSKYRHSHIEDNYSSNSSSASDYSSIDDNSSISVENEIPSMPYVSYEEVRLSPIHIDDSSSLYQAVAHFTNRSAETIAQYDYTVLCYPSGEERYFVMFGTTGPGKKSDDMKILPDKEMLPYEVVYSYDNSLGYEITVTYNFSTRTYEVLDSELRMTRIYKDGELIGSH